MGPATRRIPYSRRKRGRLSRQSPTARSPSPSPDQVNAPPVRRHSSRSQKAQLIMPIGRISSYLKNFVDRSGADAAVYLAAAIQYFVVEVVYGVIKFMYLSQIPGTYEHKSQIDEEGSFRKKPKSPPPPNDKNVSTLLLKNKRITPEMLHKSLRMYPELGGMFIDRSNFFPVSAYEKGVRRKSKKRSKSKGKVQEAGK